MSYMELLPKGVKTKWEFMNCAKVTFHERYILPMILIEHFETVRYLNIGWWKWGVRFMWFKTIKNDIEEW